MKHLAGGEKQRVQFARALAQIDYSRTTTSSRILFLDEPLNNLDIRHQLECLQLAKDMLDGYTIVIATLHDINLAIHFSDHLLFLKQGRIIFETESALSVAPGLIRDVFEVDSTVIEMNGKSMISYNSS